jgi:hypothetical protein
MHTAPKARFHSAETSVLPALGRQVRVRDEPFF